MQRTVRSLHDDWRFLPRDEPAAHARAFDDSAWAAVTVPHANVELPHHNFSETEYAFVSTYRRAFDVSVDARGRRVLLDFDGAMLCATVFVNGTQVGDEHKGGFTPFTRDVTDFVDFGGSNTLAVRLDSTERADVPPFGNVVDYMTFGGLYRDVWLRTVDRTYIEDVFAKPQDVLSDAKKVEVTARVVNTTGEADRLRLTVTIEGEGVACEPRTVEAVVMPNSFADVTATLDNVRGARLWTLDDPALYRVTATLDDGDAVSHRVGFRAAEFRDDGRFYLNGERLHLRGLNRHQNYPYIGCAAPARLQRQDALVLKRDLAVNVVRCSHYPQSPHFLDACDELGLLALEETPGWQHVGDGAWQTRATDAVRAMIVRDRNRPSLISWGVRINESGDFPEFYAATNKLARALDPTRQTHGVRYHFESERLEDVFTFNDFGYDLRPPNHPRYLVTEFCGHMYPTKTFDQEERVRQHVVHHAHVHDQTMAPTYAGAGAIGWCAFDYNTHKEFGSGDRICYHGVMDIFREPKFAAHFYACHADPKVKPVLEPITYWKIGDKSGGGVDPMLVVTNCDEVEVEIGGEARGRFRPDREAYPHLPHPPIVARRISANWGNKWLPLTVHGYVGGERVVTKHISNDGIPRKLVVHADSAELVADARDMTRVGLRVTDEHGNVLPFCATPVTVALDGPGVLVGESAPHPMPGGRGCVFVRATRAAGTVTLRATAPRLEPVTATIEVRPA